MIANFSGGVEGLIVSCPTPVPRLVCPPGPNGVRTVSSRICACLGSRHGARIGGGEEVRPSRRGPRSSRSEVRLTITARSTTFQFTHIAGPIIGRERLERGAVNARDWLPMPLLAVLLNKAAGQKWNLKAFGQRRKAKRKDIQAVEQVGTKSCSVVCRWLDPDQHSWRQGTRTSTRWSVSHRTRLNRLPGHAGVSFVLSIGSSPIPRPEKPGPAVRVRIDPVCGRSRWQGPFHVQTVRIFDERAKWRNFTVIKGFLLTKVDGMAWATSSCRFLFSGDEHGRPGATISMAQRFLYAGTVAHQGSSGLNDAPISSRRRFLLLQLVFEYESTPAEIVSR